MDYLKRLNERYEAWISTYDKGKLLIIDVDNNNFIDSPEDLPINEQFMKMIEQKSSKKLAEE